MLFQLFPKMEAVFSQRIGVRDLPAEPIHVALYITNLLDSGSSSHVVNH